MDGMSGIFKNVGEMAEAEKSQILTLAFVGYIMHVENCKSSHATQRMADLCATTQSALAQAILETVGNA